MGSNFPQETPEGVSREAQLTPESRVLIIGAGPTGLGAAWRLRELGHENFSVLESLPYAGGLAHSFQDDIGFTWDIGGHVMFSHYEYYDRVFDEVTELEDLPRVTVDRIVHYFATYKLEVQPPGENTIEVVGTYGAEEARQVVAAAMEDYAAAFPAH